MWKPLLWVGLMCMSLNAFVVPPPPRRAVQHIMCAELDQVLLYCGGKISKWNECTGKNTVLYISSETNDRCSRIGKRLQKLAEDFPEISFHNLQVRDNDYEIFMTLRVPTTPYFIFYRDGKRVYEHKSFDTLLIHNIVRLLT